MSSKFEYNPPTTDPHIPDVRHCGCAACRERDELRAELGRLRLALENIATFPTPHSAEMRRTAQDAIQALSNEADRLARPKPTLGGPKMPEYRQYRRTQIAEMADWGPDTDMAGVSISEPDRKAGSPKPGDKIARNPANHEDRWLVAADYFAANFEPLGSSKEC